uniref:Uncharacterized protein n=1 Tax=Pithovirus LCPAC304 TaxID=2506594 RepID=A0A481Z7B7_9VIRU|nr:MAG: hypothetical protein LCPAC304_00960 [Pithovirus LCPAC304]
MSCFDPTTVIMPFPTESLWDLLPAEVKTIIFTYTSGCKEKYFAEVHKEIRDRYPSWKRRFMTSHSGQTGIIKRNKKWKKRPKLWLLKAGKQGIVVNKYKIEYFYDQCRICGIFKCLCYFPHSYRHCRHCRKAHGFRDGWYMEEQGDPSTWRPSVKRGFIWDEERKKQGPRGVGGNTSFEDIQPKSEIL